METEGRFTTPNKSACADLASNQITQNVQTMDLGHRLPRLNSVHRVCYAV